MKKLSRYTFKNEGNSAEISLYGVIDGSNISAQSIKEALDELHPDSITLRINSVGGDIQEGIAIANIIKSYGVPTTAYIDSLCASIATVIAVSADKVVMAGNASFMIHKARVVVADSVTAKELITLSEAVESMNQAIKQSYLDKGVKLSESKLDSLMDKETWLNAQEALNYGFVDEIGKATKATACATRQMLNMYENAPDDLPTEPDEPDNNDEPDKEESGEETLDELMKNLFETVGKIQKVYKPEDEPDSGDDPEKNKEPEKAPNVENMFKAFFNSK